jgi:hypothetical protein
MKKTINFKSDFKHLYTPKAKIVQEVEVPTFTCLMVDGSGHPAQAPDFQDKIGLIFGLAYTLKFMLKDDPEQPLDFTVAPLGCRYDATDPHVFTDPTRTHEWQWTLLIPIPAGIAASAIARATAVLRAKKNPPHIDQLRVQPLTEGHCLQVMHLGPYNTVGSSYELLFAHAHAHALATRGPCQEIYLGDPRRAAPERLKTIVRLPVQA